MLRNSQHLSLLATAFFLVAPASAMAQKAGLLMLENRTGTTIRIGCDYYIDASGRRVNLNSYWTLPPGFNEKLTAPGLRGQSDIVARKFVFFLITPEGQSAGWFFDKITAGNLHQHLDANNLEHHKKLIRNRWIPAISQYPALLPPPPLAVQGNEIVSLKQEIANLEKSLLAADIVVAGCEAAVEVAKANNDKRQKDPNATTAEQVRAVGVLFAAETAYNVAVRKRDDVVFDLRTKRERLSQLQQSPLP